MIISFFLGFVWSSTVDLVPPFVVDGQRKVGIWEFSGFATPFDDQIILSPPIQYSKGSIWSSFKFPDESWHIDLDIGISDGTGGGGFGLWFVKNYGADGNLCGGPPKFKGIAVIGVVSQVNEQICIDFKVIQDRYGMMVFDKKVDTDVYVLLNQEKRLTLSVLFEDSKMILRYLNDSQRWVMLSETLVMAEISNNYFGISSQSDRLTSKFNIYSINISLAEEIRQNVKMGHAANGHFEPSSFSSLRSPKFNKMLLEYERYDKREKSTIFPTTEANAEYLLDIVNEMNNVMLDVASYSYVNDFVQNTILPYSQKWHIRTLKIIEQLREARNVYGAMWNYTDIMLNSFKNDINNTALKTKLKIDSLADLLLSDPNVDSEAHVIHRAIVISLDANDFDPSVLILYITIAELFIAFSFFIKNNINVR